MTEESIVVQPEPVKDYAGTPFDGAVSLSAEFNEGRGGDWDALGLAVSGGTASLETLGLVLDPLGGIVRAGVGWLLEHVEFLREPIEVLTGDPAQIKALSQTWHNVATELTQAADDYDRALAAVATWDGTAAAAYRGTAQDCIGGVRGSALQAEDAAQGVTVVGIAIATERGIVFDLITTLISRLITQALIAAASSVVTLGGSVAAFLAGAVAQATALAARISTRLGRLLQALARAARKFGQIGRTAARAGQQALDRTAGIRRSARQVADSPYATYGAPTAKAVNDFLGEPEDHKPEGENS